MYTVFSREGRRDVAEVVAHKPFQVVRVFDADRWKGLPSRLFPLIKSPLRAMANLKPKSNRHLALLLAVPLLLSIIWPWSYFLADSFAIAIGKHQLAMNTGPGWMAFTIGPPWSAPTWLRLQNHPVILDGDSRQLLANPQVYSGPNEYHFYYPLWLLTLASVLLAIGLIVSHARRIANYKPGCCDVCGYDLRASPGRCPECGTVRA